MHRRPPRAAAPGYPPPILLSLLALSCTAQTGPTGQSPLDLHLVVHVDPLPRRGAQDCADELLTSCAPLSAPPWQERIDNLAWLSDRWTETGRTLDLQWGPEMALSLAEDPDVLAQLRDGLVDAGSADPDAVLADTVATGQAAVQQLLDADLAAFASHVHTVALDSSGLWGTGPLAGGGPHPCDAWQDDPLEEAPLESTEATVWIGAVGAQALADRFGQPLRSWTGAVPRVLASKAQVLQDPDALDPAIDRDFPDAFQPWLLGEAYSECLTRVTGHPPFELYRATEHRALGGGDGPLVHPGEPVIGQLDEHLDMLADGSAGAAARRLLQGLLAWRQAALTGQPDRPWAYAAHTHLFHLDAGDVPPNDPTARQLSPVDGMPFRQDTEAWAAFADRFAGGAWQGVAASDGGGPVRWTLPGDVAEPDATFSLGDPDAPPPQSLDELDDAPYPRILAAGLADTHLVCTGSLDEVEVYGLLQCAGGWAWGGDRAGFHCAVEDTEPAWRYVLVPRAGSCLAGVEALRAASVGAESWGEPRWCSGGLEVPVEGLLVQPQGQGGVLAAACDTALGPGG